RLVRRADGHWRFTPLAVSLLCGLMVWLHYLFDLNVSVAAICGTSLLIAWATDPTTWPRASATRARLGTLGVGLVAAARLGLAWDWADRTAIALWAIVLLAGRRLALRALGPREVWLCLVLALVFMNLLPAVLPLARSPRGATRLGAGLAYDFCES